MHTRTLAIGGLLLALAACGGGAGSWRATDACAMLDKGVVAATLGSAVTKAALDMVKKDGEGPYLYSQCTYDLADGRLLVFGTAENEGVSVTDQVADIRRQAAMMSDVPAADVPGVGKAALWVPQVGTLYAFLGDGRWASTTLVQMTPGRPKPTPEKTKADGIALIRTVGG